MNETYGMSTFGGISQDNSVANYHPDLSGIIQVWPSYPNLSRDMQVYTLFLSYPNLRFQVYTRISRNSFRTWPRAGSP